jgi:hypothetical protein
VIGERAEGGEEDVKGARERKEISSQVTEEMDLLQATCSARDEDTIYASATLVF